MLHFWNHATILNFQNNIALKVADIFEYLSIQFSKTEIFSKNIYFQAQISNVYCRRAWVVEREIEIEIGNIIWF